MPIVLGEDRGDQVGKIAGRGASPEPRGGDASPRTPRGGFGVLARRCAADPFAEAFALLAHRCKITRETQGHRGAESHVGEADTVPPRELRARNQKNRPGEHVPSYPGAQARTGETGAGMLRDLGTHSRATNPLHGTSRMWEGHRVPRSYRRDGTERGNRCKDAPGLGSPLKAQQSPAEHQPNVGGAPCAAILPARRHGTGKPEQDAPATKGRAGPLAAEGKMVFGEASLPVGPEPPLSGTKPASEWPQAMPQEQPDSQGHAPKGRQVPFGRAAAKQIQGIACR